jgi:hypothetical protein
MIIIWGKSVTAPHFSMKCGKKCIIIEPVVEGFGNSYIQWNRIGIHQSEMPKDAEYGLIKRRHTSINRLSSIDFCGPYVVKSIELYTFRVSGSELESEGDIVDYDGCLVFQFDDGRRFAVSSYGAPGGMLGFTMDRAEIENLTSLSSQRKLII